MFQGQEIVIGFEWKGIGEMSRVVAFQSAIKIQKSQIPMKWRATGWHMIRPQSQRDCVTKPRVAAAPLPWVAPTSANGLMPRPRRRRQKIENRGWRGWEDESRARMGSPPAGPGQNHRGYPQSAAIPEVVGPESNGLAGGFAGEVKREVAGRLIYD